MTRAGVYWLFGAMLLSAGFGWLTERVPVGLIVLGVWALLTGWGIYRDAR